MNGNDDKMASHLTATLEITGALGGLILALFSPGPLIPKVVVLAVIGLALALVTTWHLGYRAGCRRQERIR